MPCTSRIFATGFNAHGQLHPLTKGENIYGFQSIAASDDSAMKVCGAFWSATILVSLHDGTIIHLGHSGDHNHNEIEWSEVSTRWLAGIGELRFFGDVSGIKGYVPPGNHDIDVLQQDGTVIHRSLLSRKPFILPEVDPVEHIAIAGNEKVCVVTRPVSNESRYRFSAYYIHVFATFSVLLSGEPPESSYPLDHQGVESVTASATTFTILTDRGQVVTFGDARFPSLLARTPSADCPASEPTSVTELEQCDIATVVGGSRLFAALSKSDDLFVWGHALPRPLNIDHSGIAQLLSEPDEDEAINNVHEIDIEGEWILKVAIGDDHIVILTFSGTLWGLGSNEYGQLGLPREVKGTEGKWVRMFTEIGQRESVQGISAAPFATFLEVQTSSAASMEDTNG